MMKDELNLTQLAGERGVFGAKVYCNKGKIEG